MSSWIDQSARRMLLAGALAFTVGAPTIACMGGDSTSEEGGDDGDGGGEDEAKDAYAKSLGNWSVQPSKEDLRTLKVIDMGLKPKIKESDFKAKLKPPPTDQELALFREIKKLPKDSPEAQFMKMQIKAMKQSNLEITEDTWTLDMAGEKEVWKYTVVSSDDTVVTVKLDSGETNTLTFVKDDKVKVKISDAGGSMELVFKRK